MRKKSAMQEAVAAEGVGSEVEMLQVFGQKSSDIFDKVGNIPLSQGEMALVVDNVSDGLAHADLIKESAERTGDEELIASVDREVLRIFEGPTINPPDKLLTDAFPVCTRAKTLNELRACIKEQYGLGFRPAGTGPSLTFGHVVDAACAIAGASLIDFIDESSPLEF